LSGTLLDVGCGTKPYEPYIRVDKYTGLEIDSERSRLTSKADLFYDGKKFPSADKEYDAVLANEVFEHVFNPVEFLREINRVLKPEGKFLLTVPFVWDEHEQPYDYARYSSFGLKHVLEEHGFEIVRHTKSVNDLRVIFQLWNEYLYKTTYVEHPMVRQVLNTLCISPFTILGLLLYWIFPANNDLYLDNVILAKKVRDV
jgi:SAM-dependent methyltransferase